MRVFTREQLHELVWSKPMTTLAKEFGLSDVALHKICRKHDVPTPPPGWWAKHAAGKKVRVTPLPKLKDDIADRIVITGGELRREPEALAAAREQARVIASSDFPQDTPHPIAERTIATLRRSKPGSTGLVSSDGRNVIRCEVAPASIDRLDLVLRRIIAAAGQQGFALERGEQNAWLVGAGETVNFSITENFRRVKHELTEKEQAEEVKWQRKRERQRLTNSWDWDLSRPRFPEWDYQPTGQLGFELEHVYSEGSPRRTFRDGEIQRLEDMAGDIAVGIAVIAAAKFERRRQCEAEQRRQEERRQLREQAMRAKHVEERRTAALDHILDELAQVERLRVLLGKLEVSDSSDLRLREFVRWTEDRLERKYGALRADGLAKRFTDERLFGEDDDHEFRPTMYY